MQGGADEIIRRWQESVLAGRAAEAVEGAEAPLPPNSIPLVLDEILSVIESGDDRIVPEKICHAARHGRERARQQLDVRDMVLEYQSLRRHIFLYLQEHAEQLGGLNLGDMADIFRRVGLAVDEAMCETLSAFVEERTGGCDTYRAPTASPASIITAPFTSDSTKSSGVRRATAPRSRSCS